MSDVILTALITGAVGVVGNIGQYLATRRQTKVELARIGADDRRAHAARVEDARQARRATYQRLLTVLHDLDRLASSDAPSDEELEHLHGEWLIAHNAILLDAPREVTEAMDGVTSVLTAIGQAEEKQRPVDAIAFQRAFRPRDIAFIEARAVLLSAMHDDVTKPLLPES